MITEQYIVSNIWDVMYALFNSYTTSPWNRWNVIQGYNADEIYKAEDKNYLYIETPVMMGEIRQKAGRSRFRWEMPIGFWVTDSKGGINEMSVFESQILYLINNPQDLHHKQFNVTLGATTYTDKTLSFFGIKVRSLIGARRELGGEIGEYRREVEIQFIA